MITVRDTNARERSDDGAAVSDEGSLELRATEDAEVLVVDLG